MEDGVQEDQFLNDIAESDRVSPFLKHGAREETVHEVQPLFVHPVSIDVLPSP